MKPFVICSFFIKSFQKRGRIIKGLLRCKNSVLPDTHKTKFDRSFCGSIANQNRAESLLPDQIDDPAEMEKEFFFFIMIQLRHQNIGIAAAAEDRFAKNQGRKPRKLFLQKFIGFSRFVA
ncbi:hypothetical protein SDC9_125924 [bioreactor metagenome]|uniref:Uncharacterized protein n=1 Tax=bioreactor metagenome TaxID=1076179 RepID=A0A645CPS2_9ZZZZ